MKKFGRIASVMAAAAAACCMGVSAFAESMSERNERIAADIIERGVDPMTPDNISKPGDNYGFHIEAGDGKVLQGTGEGADIPFLFENTGKPVKFGVRVYVQGIEQEFSGDSVFSLEMGEKLETVFHVEQLRLPENYRGGNVPVSIILTDMTGDICFFPESRLSLSTEGYAVTEETVVSAGSSHVITEREDIRFSIGKDFMEDTMGITLMPRGSDRHFTNMLPAAEDGVLSLEVMGWSTFEEECVYRLSVYRNGEKVLWNGEDGYIDVSLKKGMMTCADVTLEAAEGDKLEVAAVPLGNEKMRSRVTFFSVMNGADIPEDMSDDHYYYPVKLSPEQEKIRYEQILAAYEAYENGVTDES